MSEDLYARHMRMPADGTGPFEAQAIIGESSREAPEVYRLAWHFSAPTLRDGIDGHQYVSGKDDPDQYVDPSKKEELDEFYRLEDRGIRRAIGAVRAWKVGPEHDPVPMLLAYAAAKRVKFAVGAGYTIPTQIVFVPMLLLLPNASSKALRVETYAGFSAEQIRLFGEIPASFFSMQRRTLIEDIETPGTYFPFMDAAEQVGFRAVFSAPIVNSRGEALGVVATFFRNPHAPTDRQSRLVELYARQAANALDNARLYHNSLETLAAEQHRTAVLRSLAEASLAEASPTPRFHRSNDSWLRIARTFLMPV